MQDQSTSKISAGPFKLTYAEYMSTAWAARTGALYKTYAAVVCALLAMSIQLVLWGFSILAARLALGSFPPLEFVIGAIVVAGLLAIYAVLGVIGPAVGRSHFKRLIASKYAFTVDVSSEGVISTCGEIASRLPWSVGDRVVEKQGCFLLFLSELAAIIVPRRAFPSTAAADAFLTFAKARCDASRA